MIITRCCELESGVAQGAPFAELPSSFRGLQPTLLKRPGSDQEMVDILALVLHHDKKEVEQAVDLALRSGPVSKQHVFERLMRLPQGPQPAPMDTPSTLDRPRISNLSYSVYPPR